MNNALTVRDSNALALAPEQWEIMWRQANAFVKSGFLPESIKSAEQAIAIIMTGYELGIPSMTALRTIHVIKGRPTLSATLMAALIQQAHGDDALQLVQSSDQVATYRFKRRGWAEYSQLSYTIEQARQAGLLSKDTWKQHPAPLLRARCISSIATANFQDVTLGLYTPEEMGVPVEVDAGSGEVRYEPANGPNVVEGSARVIADEPAASGNGKHEAAETSNGNGDHTLKRGAKVRFTRHLRKLGQSDAQIVELLAALSGGKDADDLTYEQLREIADTAEALWSTGADVDAWRQHWARLRELDEQVEATKFDQSDATPEQVAHLVELVRKLGWRDEEIVEYLAPFGAETWEDLTVARAAWCMRDMESQIAPAQVKDRRQEIAEATSRLATSKRM